MFKNPKFYMVRTLHFFVFCTDLRTDYRAMHIPHCELYFVRYHQNKVKNAFDLYLILK